MMYVSVIQLLVGAFILSVLSGLFGWFVGSRGLVSTLMALDETELLADELEAERDYYRTFVPQRDKNGRFIKKTRTK